MKTNIANTENFKQQYSKEEHRQRKSWTYISYQLVLILFFSHDCTKIYTNTNQQISSHTKQ